MRRMADYHFAQATTWAALHAVHERFVYDYNEQAHWAHRERPEGKRSPATVLGWVQGAWCEPAELDRLFRIRSRRRVDPGGYVRYRHWGLYGERGLRGAEAAVWACGELVTIEYGVDALAQYGGAYEPDERHLREVADVHLFETRHPSPQPYLNGVAETAWHPALRAPRRAQHRRRGGGPAEQLPLFTEAEAAG